MNYKLPGKLNWCHYSAVILFFLINPFINNKLYIPMNIDFTFWGFIINTLALIVAVIIYLAGVIKEKIFNKGLKKLLLNELFSNLLSINDNLRIIENFEKNPKIVYLFAYITNNIFHSLINTNRIAILKCKK